MATLVNQRTKYLIGKWGNRINLVEKANKKPLTFERRAALANALENCQERLVMKEATNPGSIGQYKRYALDIVTATVPNLIAFDMLSVQSMDNRVGMINYIDYRYSKAKGATAAGDVFASSINMGPSDHLYSSNAVEGEVVGTIANTTGTAVTLPWAPVLLDTFTLESSDGAVIGVCDASGTITGTGITSGTLTAAGQLTVTYTNTSSTADVIVSYKFDNESVQSDGPVATGFTNASEVELKISSIPVTAQARTMRSFWAFDSAFELQKEYGQDIETLLATTTTGELAHEIDNELSLDLLRFANAGPMVTWSKTQPTGVNLVDHYDSLNAKLIEGSNQIYNATRKVKANFICCGLQVANIIEMLRNFTPSGVSAVGPYFAGTLGNLKVFVNPDYPSRSFVLGYKGSNMFEAGAFYCPYMPVSSTDLIMDANFRGQRGWATMYGKKLINDKMYIRGVVTD